MEKSDIKDIHKNKKKLNQKFNETVKTRTEEKEELKKNSIDSLPLQRGERIEATVIFADMKDFTKFTENLDAEDIDKIMNKIFSNFESIIKGYDGWVEKYIGDALVAVFGAKHIHEDDPERAINASLDFFDNLQILNSEIKSKFKIRNKDISFRIGIHSGTLTKGKRGDFEVVTGHALAIASRIQSIAAANSILISETIYSKTSTKFIFSEPIELSIRGKSEKLNAFIVLGRNLSIINYNTEFIGRNQILDKMLRKYLKFDDQAGFCYYLYGEAGIGKTRILVQFIEEIRKFPLFASPLFYTSASPYGNSNFSIIIKLLLFYLKLANIPKLSEQEILKHLFENGIKLEQDKEKVLIKLLSLKWSGDLDEKTVFDTLLNAFLIILKKFEESIYAPIIFIDNINFIDKKSRDFLRYLIDHLNYKPFFLVSDRAFDPIIANIFPNFEKIELPPFSENESHTMIEKLIEIDLSEEDKRFIIEQSHGNPFFIEEFAKFINIEGEFKRLPSSIQTIILAHIDRLPENQKYILQKASVIGSTFSIEELSYIHAKTGGDISNLDLDITKLINENIIERTGKQFKFRQEITREVVYSTILKENKMILHRLIALFFIKIKRKEPLKIIYHCIEAADIYRAYKLLSQVTSFTMDYVPYLDKLLVSFHPKEAEKIIDILFIKYSILYNNGFIDKIPEVISQMGEKVFSLNNNRAYALFYHVLATYNYEHFDYFNAELFGRKGLYYYEQLDSQDKSKIYSQNLIRFTAIALFYKRNIDGAKKLLEKLPEKTVEFNYLNCIINFYTSNYERSLAILEKEKEKIKNGVIYDDFSISLYLGELISFYYELGAFERLYDTCLLFIQKVVPTYKQYSRIYSYLGISSFYLGKHGEAFDYLKKAEYNTKQLNNDYYKARVQAFIAEAYYLSGNLEKAYEYAFDALKITNINSDHVTSCEVLILLVLISLQKNDFEKAKFFLSEIKMYENSSIILEFKYKPLIFYLRYKLDDSINEKEKKEILLKASEIIMNNIKKLHSPYYKQTFLKIRFHQNIVDEAKKYQN